jgi:hypothetical protein
VDHDSGIDAEPNHYPKKYKHWSVDAERHNQKRDTHYHPRREKIGFPAYREERVGNKSNDASYINA